MKYCIETYGISSCHDAPLYLRLVPPHPQAESCNNTIEPPSSNDNGCDKGEDHIVKAPILPPEANTHENTIEKVEETQRAIVAKSGTEEEKPVMPQKVNTV